MRSGRKTRLIDDIVPAAGSKEFNPDHLSVQHQPIGKLYEQYYSQKPRQQRLRINPVYITNGPTNTQTYAYTTIPPLQVLDRFLENDSPALAVRRLSAAARGAAITTWNGIRLFGSAIVGAVAVAHSGLVRRLPNKYSAEHGLYIDWEANSVLFLRRFAPVALLLAVFVLLVLFEPKNNKVTPGTQPPQPSTSTNGVTGGGGHAAKPQAMQGQTNNSSSSTASANATSTPSTGSSSAAAGSGSGAAQSGSTALAPTAGRGGVGSGSSLPTSSGTTTSGSGSTPPPSSGGGSSSSGSGGSSGGSGSGPIPTTTVTVPPLNVSGGGKQLVNTTGTSLTLN